jgi:hypothetical protein
MWVRFLRDFICVPEDRRTSFGFKAGYKGNVRRICADKAIAAGAAEPVNTPPRGDHAR